MRYGINHETVYRYEEKVSYSHHLVHLRPLESETQNHLHSRLTIFPTPDIVSSHRDYFGNETTFFSISVPHDELRIVSQSEVEVRAVAEPDERDCLSWEDLRDGLAKPEGVNDMAAAEFIYASPLCPLSRELADYARESFQPGRAALEAVLELNQRIHRDFAFNNSATTVTTPVEEVFAKRAGVCQDFAHLQIACLRSLGLPARYVSGYLRTDPPPGEPRAIGADASHAWVSFYYGGGRWMELDPTNDVIPTDYHLRVAYGRDYHDICPIRGTVYGGGTQKLAIGVTVTPLGGGMARQ